MEQTKPLVTTAEQIAMEEYRATPSASINDMFQIRDRNDNCIGVVRELSDAAMLAKALNSAFARGQQDARSVAHPPTSELVSAGNAMCALLCLFYKEAATSLPAELRKNLVDLVNQWEKAVVAHPKEVAPTVEETVDELMEFLEDYIEEGIEEMHDHSSDHGWQYDRGHPNWNATMDDLRTRLTKLLTTP